MGNLTEGATVSGAGISVADANLTLTGTTISNNLTGARGAGVSFAAFRSPASATIDGSTFTGNTVYAMGDGTSPSAGGALALVGYGSALVTNSTFDGNFADSTGAGQQVQGGAIYNEYGNLMARQDSFTGNSMSGPGANGSAVLSLTPSVVQYSRIVGNVGAPAVSSGNGAPSVAADDDWWGCNTGPNSPGCDTASNVSSYAYLTLTANASPAHVLFPNATSVITASLLTDSRGQAIPGSYLTAFDGLPVTFADPPGDATVTPAPGDHTVPLSVGVAPIDYRSNTTVGTDNVPVSMDNATTSAALEVDQSPAFTSPDTVTINSVDPMNYWLVGVASSGYPAPTFSTTGFTYPFILVPTGPGTAAL